jgi:hypothetical protein
VETSFVRHFTLKPEHFPSHARDKHRETMNKETFLQAKAEASSWAKGQVVDIETEDGWERGCTILGKNRTRVLPSNSLLKGPLEAREKEPTDVFLLSRQARDKRKEHSTIEPKIGVRCFPSLRRNVRPDQPARCGKRPLFQQPFLY